MSFSDCTRVLPVRTSPAGSVVVKCLNSGSRFDNVSLPLVHVARQWRPETTREGADVKERGRGESVPTLDPTYWVLPDHDSTGVRFGRTLVRDVGTQNSGVTVRIYRLL